MKVLYDHQIFETQEVGGISRYIAELIKHDPEAVCSIRYSNNVYLKDERFAGYTLLPKDYEEERFLPGLNFRGKRRLSRRWIQFFQKTNKALSIDALKKGDFDVFHPTYYDTYFLQYIGRKPFVMMVHDMIYELFPLYYDEDNPIGAIKRELITRASHITVNSESTKKDLLSFYPEVEHKVTVTYLACSFSGIETPLSKEAYILFTGSRDGYKNFSRFVEAAAPILSRFDMRLICTGPDFTRSERSQFEELAVSRWIEHRFASEDEMESLYRRAVLFVFPSLYEGFGMPVLEAFASCCPAVLSNASSLPEVGGEAAAYFDPRDIVNMREVIEAVIGSPGLQQDLIERGKEQVRKFSWERCAGETERVYERVIQASGDAACKERELL